MQMMQPTNGREEGRDQGDVWSRLNGHRIPLAVIATIAVPLSIGMINMWADVRELKSSRINAIGESRVAVLEEQIKHMRADMLRADENLRRVDEDSRKDRERIWAVLEREHAVNRR
jgi:hypothetical protein